MCVADRALFLHTSVSTKVLLQESESIHDNAEKNYGYYDFRLGPSALYVGEI